MSDKKNKNQRRHWTEKVQIKKKEYKKIKKIKNQRRHLTKKVQIKKKEYKMSFNGIWSHNLR